MNFTGTVQRVNANPFRGKTLYSFTLRGVDGYFNTGDKALSIVEGQQVEFEAAQAKRAGNFDVNFNTIKVVQGAGVSQPASASTPVTQRSGGAVRSADIMSKDDYWKRREERDLETQKVIQLQAARNAAIALAAVVFDGADTSTDAMFKAVENYVDETTARFVSQNAGPVTDAPATTPATDKDWK